MLTFFILCVLGFLFYRFSFSIPTDAHIENELIEYWSSRGFQEVEVFKLSNSEKVHYGIPILHLTKFADMAFSFMRTIPFRTNRRVEMVDREHTEHVKFVEAIFFGGELTDCRNLESYEF